MSDISAELLSDLEILAEACRGDRRQFEVLMQRYFHLIYSLAYRLRGDRQEAREVTRETILRVARSIRSFSSTARFRTWLYRLTLKVDFDYTFNQRRSGRKPSARTYEDECPLNRRVLLALDSLTKPERETIIFAVYEGLTAAQIAEIFGCAESTISWRMYTARRKVSSALSKLGAAPDGGPR